MILGIDAGGNGTKVCGPQGIFEFPSEVGEYRELKLKNVELRRGDMMFEYRGLRGFAGLLARDESELSDSFKSITKAHDEAILRVLLACCVYSNDIDHQIVVGQPIQTYTEAEKRKIKELLKGKHEITFNGQKRIIAISSCEVSPEGACVGLLMPRGQKRRIIDIGSGTVNFGTVSEDNRFSDRESWTEELGVNLIRNMQPDAFGRVVGIKASTKWKKNDGVIVSGGGAMNEKIVGAIKEFFPNLFPVEEPVTANSRAFYAIARKLYV